MLPQVLTDLLARQEVNAWRQVPGMVASRIKQASDIQRQVRSVISTLPSLASGYGMVYWNPDTKVLWLNVGDSDETDDILAWTEALGKIDGVSAVQAEAEVSPPADWIRIKKAAALEWLNTPYQLAGKLTGGPSPLSNAVVSGLLGSGAGYTIGTAAESLLPEQYFERGKLRKNLAAIGGVGGAMMHAPAALANMSINSKATGSPHILRSIMGGDALQEMSPEELDWRNHFYGNATKLPQLTSMLQSRLPEKQAANISAASLATKAAFDTGVGGTASVPLHPVPVDEFNNAIWNDVDNHNRSPYAGTPPANAAAAVGIVTGIQQMAGNPPLLSPKHFINGLVNAGLDAATATVAGGILGTLGGLKPDAQRQLQQMGVWGGMIRGVTGSVLGLR